MDFVQGMEQQLFYRVRVFWGSPSFAFLYRLLLPEYKIHRKCLICILNSVFESFNNFIVFDEKWTTQIKKRNTFLQKWYLKC